MGYKGNTFKQENTMARKQTHDWEEVFGDKMREAEGKGKKSFGSKVRECLAKVWQWLCNLFI